MLQEREARRQAFAQEVGQAARHDHSAIGCGVCISGAEVAKVEASFGEVSPVDGDPNLFRIRLDDAGTPLGWSDTLVTLADGRVCSVCVVDGFVALLHVLDDASLSMFHRPIDAIEGETRFAVALLARAHAGVLGQDEIVEAAALLRGGKHRIITVGCIAAQFYDTVRDVDSLRALASFYATHGWPVPLDVVLYGGGRIHEYGGRLYADISPAPALRPRTHHEARHDQSFTSEATAGIEGHPVAGRVPWMRHAWGAVSTADCDASAEPWRRQALAAMAHLASGSFTNAQPAEGQALAELAAVEARQLAVQHLTAV